MILKERDTVNSTTNLSTWRHLTKQSMIPESSIMEWWHQRHVSRLLCPFPSPGQRWTRFAHWYFSYLTPFLPFSPTAEPGSRLILDDTLSFLQTSSLISIFVELHVITLLSRNLRRLKKHLTKKIKNLNSKQWWKSQCLGVCIINVWSWAEILPNPTYMVCL